MIHNKCRFEIYTYLLYLMIFQKFFKNSAHSSIHLLKCATKGCTIAKVGHYSTNNIVQRCVKCIITSAINRIDFYIDCNSSEDISLLQKLLHKPNEAQFKADFLETALSHYVLTGNLFILGTKNSQNQLTKLNILKSENISIIPGQYGYPEGYQYQLNDQGFYIPYDHKESKYAILHIKNFNPDNEFIGLSPLSTAESSIHRLNIFDQYDQQAAQSAYAPNGIFYFKESMHYLKDDINAAAQLEQKLADLADSSHAKALILPESIRWQELKEKTYDANFAVARQIAEKNIARAFGVPASLIGLEEPKFSNYKEARAHFLDETIAPLIKKLDSFAGWLMEFFPNLIVKIFDPKNTVNSVEQSNK